MSLNVVIERDTLPQLARRAACVIQNCQNLDEATAVLRRWLPRRFVYRGGSHIAIHRSSGDARRLVFITEG